MARVVVTIKGPNANSAGRMRNGDFAVPTFGHGERHPSSVADKAIIKTHCSPPRFHQLRYRTVGPRARAIAFYFLLHIHKQQNLGGLKSSLMY